MPADGWIDRLAPAAARPYLKLMRLDRPIGSWLLLFPCWWSIALAAEPNTWPDLWLMALFGIGAVVMRGAGCTINDILDRDIDGKVARTAGRPIASGAVSLRQAIAFLGLQLLIGLLVLVQLNHFSIMLGVASLLLVFVYPLMKRVTYWPQAWLGLTFNWGALLGWAAVRGDLDWAPVALYVGGLFWTLGYDTIYAHQDKDDDVLIGVKSSALALGRHTRPFLFATYGMTIALAAGAGVLAGVSWVFWPVLATAALHLVWQAADVDIDDGADCLAKFRSNRLFGWLLLAAIIAGGAFGHG
ncbi:4-hydroxybenzoate octaprenyltransferase [Novispirillum sp. DQ9]|uniref:4-hydroxybenzoate octaprenyltransferase n=1 Tax=Novispirillum sp. DQ9 TaxID=3398612 RepID=UPI003C7A9ED8